VAKEIKMSLPSAADLFSTQEERGNANRESVRDIPLEEISDFPNHPFKVKMDESMAESVKQYGVLVPALVREKPEGGYEMVAGHRRKMASELAEKKEMPCIVRNLTDDEAIIIMVDSNLQREQILPSEKAFAYKLKLDAMKRQGQRTDLTSSPLATKLKGQRSDEILEQQVGESKDTIRRYIRLTELITPILDMVDSGKIAMRPAVELSYQPKEQMRKKAQEQAGRKVAQKKAAQQRAMQGASRQKAEQQAAQVRELPKQTVKTIDRGEKKVKIAGKAGQTAKSSSQSDSHRREGSNRRSKGTDNRHCYRGIVTNGVVNTIEGNSGDKVARRSYNIGSTSIYGYGVFLG